MKFENPLFGIQNMLLKKWQQRRNLDNQLKKLKRNFEENNLSKYNNVKNDLDVIYNHIT